MKTHKYETGSWLVFRTTTTLLNSEASVVKCPTAESGDLLGVRGREVDAAGSALVLAVRVHGAGGLVYGLVDDVVLQLRGSCGDAVYAMVVSLGFHLDSYVLSHLIL